MKRTNQEIFFGLIPLIPFAMFFCAGCPRAEKALSDSSGIHSKPEMELHGSFPVDPSSVVPMKKTLSVLFSDPSLPVQTRNCLELVSDVTAKLHWEEDRPIRIEETESEIVIVWPSRQEGTRGFHADYEAKAVIDKRTFSVISVKRGS